MKFGKDVLTLFDQQKMLLNLTGFINYRDFSFLFFQQL